MAYVFDDMISWSVEKVSFTRLTIPIDVECEHHFDVNQGVNLNGGSRITTPISTINPKSNAKECFRLYT